MKSSSLQGAKFDNQQCVQFRMRYGIKDTDKRTIVVIMVIYIIFQIISMKNIIIIHKNDKSKTKKFLTKINVQIFCLLYSKILFLMDILPFLWNDYDGLKPAEYYYLYKDENSIKFLDKFAFICYFLICYYSSILWMELLCYLMPQCMFIQNLKKTINIAGFFIMILLALTTLTSISKHRNIIFFDPYLTMISIFSISIISFVSSAVFQWNVSKRCMEIHVSKVLIERIYARRLIIICFIMLCFEIMHQGFRITGFEEHLRVYSCFSNSKLYSIYMLFDHLFQHLFSVICFMKFFSLTNLDPDKFNIPEKENDGRNCEPDRQTLMTDKQTLTKQIRR